MGSHGELGGHLNLHIGSPGPPSHHPSPPRGEGSTRGERPTDTQNHTQQSRGTGTTRPPSREPPASHQNTDTRTDNQNSTQGLTQDARPVSTIDDAELRRRLEQARDGYNALLSGLLPQTSQSSNDPTSLLPSLLSNLGHLPPSSLNQGPSPASTSLTSPPDALLKDVLFPPKKYEREEVTPGFIAEAGAFG